MDGRSLPSSTVEELVEALGLEPKRPALYAFLTRNVPDSGVRRAMRKGAKHELDRTEAPISSEI